MKKLYVVHSNEVLPYNTTENKIVLVTDDLEKAQEAYKKGVEDWKKERTGSENYTIETDTTKFSDSEVETYFCAFMQGDYNNDHYEIQIDIVEPVLMG